MESTFLTTTKLFGSPLICSMSDGITYCSAFSEDAFFGAIINFFKFRWTSSSIAIPEYEPEEMLKAVLHALASYESNETPFFVVRILLSGTTPHGTLHPFEAIETYLNSSVSPLDTCGLCQRTVNPMTRRRLSLRLNGQWK